MAGPYFLFLSLFAVCLCRSVGVVQNKNLKKLLCTMWDLFDRTFLTVISPALTAPLVRSDAYFVVEVGLGLVLSVTESDRRENGLQLFREILTLSERQAENGTNFMT